MRIVKWLVLLMLLLVALVCAGVAWVVSSQGGRDWLVAQVNDYTSRLETPVVLGKLEGNLFNDVRLSSLTVADRQGVWLSADNMRLVWQPLALLGVGRPFDMLEIARIVVARLPVNNEAEIVAEADEASVDVLGYLRFMPVELKLADVQVDAPVVGRAYRLQAGIVSEGDLQRISVTTLAGPATHVSGTVVVKALDDVALDVRLVEAPRGLIGGLLQLPENVGISGTLAGMMQGEHIRVDRLDVRAGQTHIIAMGGGLRSGDVVSGSVVFTGRDLSELRGMSGVGLRGKARMRAVVDGGLDGLDFGVVVSDTEIAVSDTKIMDLVANVNGSLNIRETAVPFKVSATAGGRLALDGGRGEVVDVRVGAVGAVSPLMVSGTLDGTWGSGTRRFVANIAGESGVTQAALKRLQVTGPGTLVSGSGVVDLQNYTANGSAIISVADLGALAGMFGVKIKGKVNANVAAEAKNGAQTADVEVRALDVDYEGINAVLKKPSRLVWDGKIGNLTPFVLDIAGGTLIAQGRMGDEIVAGTLVVEGVDIGQLAGREDVAGKASLRADISGRPAAPVIAAKGRFEGRVGDIPVNADVNGGWRGEQLAVKAAVASGELKAVADATVQGGLSLIPFEVGIGPDSRLDGRVGADIDLAVFNPLLWSSRSQIAGRVSGSVVLGGVLAAPVANGRFVLSGGDYLQSTSGMCLKNIGAEIVASNDVVEIKNLQSADGEGGLLTGSGRFGLQGDNALRAQLGMKSLRLFCGGLASGQVDGTLGVSGVLADHTVTGNVLVGPLNVRIPGASRQVDIPQVAVERVSARRTASLPVVTRLNVVLDAPQQIYVRGRGLDAEFGGKLTVTGTAGAPQIHGSLSALRGHYTLLDRSLDLADSSVRFEGPVPPSPYLAIKATTRAQGTDITLNVVGTAVKPQLALSSSPALPQDEVLALLLFGRKLANISAFEALKLAQATRVMAGLDGGEPGILDKARETLGVDTLDIGSSEEGDTTVTTGKYLTDDVYLSYQQGTEPEDRLFKTEIELTPSVTGNTTVDGVGNQSIGIEWKRDY